MLGQLDRHIQQGLIGNHLIGLDAAGRGKDHLRLAVIDAGRQFIGGETAEHHRVNRANPRTGQHAEHRLGNHRHINDDSVALDHAQAGQHTGKTGYLIQQVLVAIGLDGVGDGAVIDDRRLIAAPGLDMAVDGVVTAVDHAALEPAIERLVAIIQDFFPGLVPVNRLRGFSPETFRIIQRLLVSTIIGALHDGLFPSPKAV